MSGKNIQLVAFGAQDTFLFNDPEITFFNTVYKKKCNFSVETIKNVFKGNINFDSEINSKIQKTGDLIGFTYVEAILPPLNTNGSQVTYCNRIGFRLLKEVSLKIGSMTIDKHSSTWLLCWSELTMNNDKQNILNNLVGINRTITPDNITNINNEISDYNANENIILNIPLMFSFCRHPTYAIPLGALSYHDIEIFINLETFQNCLSTGTNNPRDIEQPESSIISMCLYSDYYFIDEIDKKSLIKGPHEFLIETVQENTYKVIPGMQSINLNMFHLIKELVWVIRETPNKTNNNLHFINYYDGSDNLAKDNNIVFSINHTSTSLNNLIKENNIFIIDQTFKIPDSSGNYIDISINNTSQRINPIIDPSGSEIDGSGVTFSGDIFTNFTSDSEITYILNNNLAKYKSNNINIKKIKTTTITVNNETFEVPYGDGNNNIIVDGDNYILEDTTLDLSTINDAKGYVKNGTINTCVESKIVLNGQDRMELRHGSYFNYVQPYQHHSGNPLIGINVYSFCLNPEDIKPSGVCNFSTIQEKVLKVNSNVNGLITIMGLGYNVLKISGGFGSLLYK
jgi:hypothetical protein